MSLPERQEFSISAGLSPQRCASAKSVFHNPSDLRFLHAVRPSALPFPSKEWTL